MTRASSELLGILPSLEVLPFFAAEVTLDSSPFQARSFSSYGEISRALLTRKLTAGVVPWEIFIADVFARPGQRSSWAVPLFLHACPTEMVLREPIFKVFYPATPSSRAKLPARLTVGIESQSSLTKAQSREWLGHFEGSRSVELSFRMLPVELMLQALEAESLDAIVAPTPWGLHAEAIGLGRRDPRFIPGKFAQQFALVCHRDFIDPRPDFPGSICCHIARARDILREPAARSRAIERMIKSEKLSVGAEVLEEAATLHSFGTLDQDMVPDVAKLVSELMRLDEFAVLPPQIAINEQTARLLLPGF